MFTRLTLLITIVHLALLSLCPDTQLFVLLVCFRVSGLSVVNFVSKAPKINRPCALALLASNAVNTLLAGYFCFVRPNLSAQSNFEWAMLIVDLMIILAVFQSKHEAIGE